MEEREGEQVLRELSSLRTQLRVVRFVAVVALLAALGAVGLALMRPKPSRIVIADKVFARELNITQTPDELAEDMARGPTTALNVDDGGHHPGVGLRPGLIAIRGWDREQGAQFGAGSITLFGGPGWELALGSDSSSLGLQLSTPTGRHWNFPDTTARTRPR